MNNKLLSIARFYFAQSVFTCNCHYSAYNRLKNYNNRKKAFTKITSGITLILLIIQFVFLKAGNISILDILSYLGILLTGTGLVTSILLKEDNEDILFEHKKYAEKYKTLRDNFMNLIEKILSNSNDEVKLRYFNDSLMEKYSLLGENAPTTTKNDYANAQNNLGIGNNSNEEFTWSDDEINRFLPKELKTNI